MYALIYKRKNTINITGNWGHAAGGAVGRGTTLQAERSEGSIPDGVIEIFH